MAKVAIGFTKKKIVTRAKSRADSAMKVILPLRNPPMDCVEMSIEFWNRETVSLSVASNVGSFEK